MFESMKNTVNKAQWFGEILSRADVKKVQNLADGLTRLETEFFTDTQLLHTRTSCFSCRHKTDEAGTKKSGEVTGYFLHRQAHL